MKDFKVNIGGAWKDTDKMYCKIDGVWKTVAGVWTKIAGAWVECKGLPEWSYYGLAPAFTLGMRETAGGSVGDYAVFAGGARSGGNYDTVHAYDNTLTRTLPTVLSKTPFRFNKNFANVGNYFVLASDTDLNSNTVNAYNTSLVRSVPSSLVDTKRGVGGTSNDNYALFGGGIISGTRNTVDAYSPALVRSTPTTLSQARNYPGVSRNAGYALFGGGVGADGTTVYTRVDAYDASLVRTTPTAFDVGRWSTVGGPLGEYALFCGGRYGSAYVNNVDAYNASLVKTSPLVLSVRQSFSAAVSFRGTFLVLAGGVATSIGTVDYVKVLNTDLVMQDLPALPEVRHSFNGAVVGDYVLFGGGYSTSDLATVPTYQYK